ncbi:MAG: MBL fold metallo-hydrolase [Gammaproteobacteria bacterium]|nr:MBL fold metallo-hydrolase [Gammaproteobacteria bacterium]
MTFVILGLFLLTLSMLLIRYKTYRRYFGPKSNHFDGRRFYNETNVRSQTPWAVLKWLLTRKTSAWPTELIHSSNPILPSPAEGQCIVTFINHSSCLIQTGKINILTDPHYSDRASPFNWIGPYRVHEPGIAYDKLPPIDVVIISHDHYDHMDRRTLIKLFHDHRPLFLVGLGNDVHLKSFGITENIKSLDWWQPLQIGNAIITFVPAQHTSRRGLLDHDTTLWGGYVLQIENANLFFAGDTGYAPHFKTIQERFGAMNLSLLPIGAYCPRWFMNAMHINPEEAVLAHLDLKSIKSIGIHFKTFDLSDESYEQPVIDLEAAKKKYNIPADAFIAPEFGESFTISLKQR